MGIQSEIQIVIDFLPHIYLIDYEKIGETYPV